MFFWMSKILAPLSEPVTYIWLLVIMALIFYRKPLIGKLCLGGVLLLLFVFGTGFIPNLMLQKLEQQYSRLVSVPPVDVVIVLSGTLDLKKSSPEYLEFNDGVERILTGIQFFKKGYAEFIIISGGSGSLSDQSGSEAVLLRQFAIELGVPEEKILIDADSRNTYENAVNTKALIEQHGFTTSILVTTASHLPRAMGCFKKLHLEPLAYPVDFRSNHNPEYHLLDIIPSVGSFVQSSRGLHEYVGILMYKFAGYI